MNKLLNAILTASFQSVQQAVGGYWINFFNLNSNYNSKNSIGSLTKDDIDFQNFLQWLDNIKDDDTGKILIFYHSLI